MSKIENDWYPEVCDCVALKRKIQAEIYEETKHMTREERREYFRKGAEQFDEAQRLRRAERAFESQPTFGR